MSEYKKQIGAGATIAVVVAFVLALSVGSLFPQQTASESSTTLVAPSSTSSLSSQSLLSSSSATISSIPTTATTMISTSTTTVTVSTTTTGPISSTTTTTTAVTSTSTYPGATVILPQGDTYQVQSSYDCQAGYAMQAFTATSASFLEGSMSASQPGVTIYVSTSQQAQTTNQGHPATWIYSTGLFNSTSFAVLLAPGSYVLWTEGADMGCGASTVEPLEVLTTVVVTQAVVLAATATTTITVTTTVTSTVTATTGPP